MGVRRARERVEHVADRARGELLATLEELEARRSRAAAWPRLAAQAPGVTALTVVGAAAALGWWRLGQHRGGRGAGRWVSPPARAAASRFALEVARRAALAFVTSWVGGRARRVVR